jgi:tetratricopeptide (TPR) repeat protein
MQIKCTSCGATQELATEHTCGYCGSHIETQKALDNYKTANTGEIGNLIMMAETSIEATNWDEALQFYNQALTKDISNSDAWLGKGIAIVNTSKIGDIKTKEAIAYWKNALKHAENCEAMGKRVAKEINTVVNSFYPAIENHYIQFNELDNSYSELVSRFGTLENALDYAIQLDKKEIKYSETGYELCKRVIKLPRIYASESKSAAQLSGTLGQFTTNKYAAAQARRDSMDKVSSANRRLAEIAKASLIIDSIQKKYVQIINELNPTHYSVSELKQYEDSKEKEVLKKALEKRQSTYIIGIMIGGFLGYPSGNAIGLIINSTGFQFGSLTKIWLFTWVLIGMFVGYSIVKNYYMKSEASKEKPNSNAENKPSF